MEGFYRKEDGSRKSLQKKERDIWGQEISKGLTLQITSSSSGGVGEGPT